MPAAEGFPPSISDPEIERLFAPLLAAKGIALAVSGGTDSLALAILAHRWQSLGPRRPPLHILTVDHGLRPESASEAALVADVALQLGLPFRLLHWQGPHPTADVEAAARAARYALLVEAAHVVEADYLATAHHRDDQAETFLMRLARGSGVYGLAGMAPLVERSGMHLFRPLLGVARSELAQIVRVAGLRGVQDPHNVDARFARARMRALMPQLANEGLDAATLAATADRLGRAAAAIDHYVGRLLAGSAIVDGTGAVRLAEVGWRSEPDEVRLRALARIVRAVGGAAYVPRLERLGSLAAAMIADDEPGLKRTLAGVVVQRRKGEFRFQREAGRDGLPQVTVPQAFNGIWDGRFSIELAVADGGPVTIGALGAQGRRALAACLPDGLPQAIEAVPAFRRQDEILAVPALGVEPISGSGIVVASRSLVHLRLEDPSRYDDV